MNSSEPGTDAGRTKKALIKAGAARGWTFSVRRGLPSAEADERWANRSTALAAWLFEQYEQHRREQACSASTASVAGHSSTPIHLYTPPSLDRAEHRATPVTGTVEAEGDSDK